MLYLSHYGAFGDLPGSKLWGDDQQQLLVATDLNVPPDWEFNFGVGVGATSSTDHLIVKAIVGRRFSWPSRPFPSDTSKGDVREKDKPKR